jgi:hypothetical protein
VIGPWFDRAKRHPSAVLLFAQLLGVVLYPFMGESPTGRAMVSLFGLVVLVLAVWTTRTTPALTWVSLLLGLPVAILTIAEALNPGGQTVLFWSTLLHGAFYFYTTYGLLRYMFADRWVTPDELWATGATFTVVAWAFAYLYVAIQIAWPGSFIAAISPDQPRTWVELLFLSFSNLTSTGLSDVAPVLPQARGLVMIEQLAGLLYVALVLSRIVGLTVNRERRAQ